MLKCIQNSMLIYKQLNNLYVFMFFVNYLKSMQKMNILPFLTFNFNEKRL
jgi:hypothetical protein